MNLLATCFFGLSVWNFKSFFVPRQVASRPPPPRNNKTRNRLPWQPPLQNTAINAGCAAVLWEYGSGYKDSRYQSASLITVWTHRSIGTISWLPTSKWPHPLVGALIPPPPPPPPPPRRRWFPGSKTDHPWTDNQSNDWINWVGQIGSAEIYLAYLHNWMDYMVF